LPLALAPLQMDGSRTAGPAKAPVASKCSPTCARKPGERWAYPVTANLTTADLSGQTQPSPSIERVHCCHHQPLYIQCMADICIPQHSRESATMWHWYCIAMQIGIPTSSAAQVSYPHASIGGPCGDISIIWGPCSATCAIKLGACWPQRRCQHESCGGSTRRGVICSILHD
jgi:hypothetical protein